MTHPLAWLAWLVAAVAVLSGTRNPLYLFLLFAEFGLVVEAMYRPGSSLSRSPILISPLRFALVVVPVTAIINMLVSHFGETVFFRIPEGIPLVGGAITAEAAVYGLLNGLTLCTLFAVFTVLNLVLPVRDLIRFIPRAFYPVAVVISIAVTFVPVTLRQLEQIRDAQAVRGRKMRGLRDWLPLFLPLLVGGMERALQLAEAMTARGFAQSERDTHAPFINGTPSINGAPFPGRNSIQWALVGALMAVLVGMLLLTMWELPLWGWSLLIVGGLVLVGSVWLAGRNVQHTTYRHQLWTSCDTWGMLGMGIALLPLLFRQGSALAYMPYPALTWPVFKPLVGMLFLGFLVPVFLVLWQAKGQTG
ncbi:MAG: energy-coupling factor transporter transmembrane protein EcfT [Anaerolineae bacterium]|nr:energy-coupling factor transporter transmembrane protein EcfT [Anaerolineae bacterium]